MSSISSIATGSISTQPASSNGFKQSLNALQSALQSGNVSGAQTALAALLKNFPQLSISSTTSTTSPSSTDSTGSTSSTTSTNAVQNDLQSIQSALQSGNVSAAQTSFTQLQTDLKSSKGHHGGHHHHGGGGGASALSSSSTQSSTSASSTSSTSTSSTSPTSENSSATNSLTTDLLDAIQAAGNTTVGTAVNVLA